MVIVGTPAILGDLGNERGRLCSDAFCPQNEASSEWAMTRPKVGLWYDDPHLYRAVLLPPVISCSPRPVLELLGSISAYMLGRHVRIGRKMKTQVIAGWQNLVPLFHFCIINHLTKEFLGCINTKQDCSSWQRDCIMFYFNEGSRLPLTSL